jgi:hypothetical protein
MDSLKSVASTAAKVVGEVAGQAADAVAGTAEAVSEKLAAVSTAPLPDDRAALLKLHREARHRRDAAPLMSKERAEAAFEIERIEIQVARIERAMDPPLV